jgi:hypothetical protein
MGVALTACSGGNSATPAPPNTQAATTTTAAPKTTTTVESSTGDGARPTIVSFTVTPADNAPCRNGHIEATMSWEVTPSTATVTVKDIGSFVKGIAGEDVGPFSSSASDVPLPTVPCDGTEHNLTLTATNGGPVSVVLTANVASVKP